jgi:hypothetical protein
LPGRLAERLLKQVKARFPGIIFMQMIRDLSSAMPDGMFAYRST